MATRVGIRILATESNRRGDVFARLVSDLFLSLGYDNVRLNIARSGREIDIEAEHRLENRRAMAECKAWDEKVGGKEINTFAGKLRSERGRSARGRVTPYFISLSGFTETSRDQEAEAGDDAVILVDSDRLVVELIKGRILVPLERATEQAGKCASGMPALSLDEAIELLAHERGWIWAISYTKGAQRTHVALIHADGTPLSASIAAQVIAADAEAGGELHTLTCLNPASMPRADDIENARTALEKYYGYLTAECGHVMLDGLPADAELGALRLNLESLFVPLELIQVHGSETDGGLQDLRSRLSRLDSGFEQPALVKPGHGRERVGTLLETHPRLAILAPPGAGKSTLLKRLAVAYADPSRRMLTDDRLPNRDWIPLLFRCRELRAKARAPFSELFDILANRAFLGEYMAAFRRKLDLALRMGEVLMLIDGLDEITVAGDRAAFVRNLRTLLAIYPRISLVVTSREGGFRQVAGLLAAVCVNTRLAEFTSGDIKRLTVAWHREVVGNRPDIIRDAEQLADTISTTDRIKRLAVNPLLLTTLLLVKRWVGQLPSRRTILYGKAVEVLLMTWNVEAHDPIEQEEALPQLCYVAFAMMRRGVQTINRIELVRLLTEARKELAAELAFARISVSEFIERVEHRSSLLMMIGVDVVDGSLVEFYEFRHLTFQEYLTAKAIVEGWYERRADTDTIASVLEPYLSEEKWREVIPLAATLAGRKADLLLLALSRRPWRQISFALTACLADEVQAAPAVIREVLRNVLSQRESLDVTTNLIQLLLSSKYSGLFKDALAEAFIGNPTIALGKLLGDTAAIQIAHVCKNAAQVHAGVRNRLTSPSATTRCEGALAMGRLSKQFTSVDIVAIRAAAALLRNGVAEQYAACLALGQIPKSKWFNVFTEIRLEFEQLVHLWVTGDRATRTAAKVALARLPITSRAEIYPLCQEESKAIDQWLRRAHKKLETRIAALVVAYYRRAPFTDNELAKLAHKDRHNSDTARAVLEALAQGRVRNKATFANRPEAVSRRGEDTAC